MTRLIVSQCICGLCTVIVKVTRRLCSSCVHPHAVPPLTACHLTALDKSPGIRPIGVGEALRHLISKAVLQTTREDIKREVGSVQLCAGQEAACETRFFTMRSFFEDKDTETVLIVDSSNAFNSLNREAALRNAHLLCPAFAPILTNTYRFPSRLRRRITSSHMKALPRVTRSPWLCMLLACYP